MKASVVISNSFIKKEFILKMNVIKYKNKEEIIFDISKLSGDELILLENAIDDELRCVNIDLFYIDDNEEPNYCVNYKYLLDNDCLVLRYIK